MGHLSLENKVLALIFAFFAEQKTLLTIKSQVSFNFIKKT